MTRVPNGWRMEQIDGWPEHSLVTSPSGGMVTIDWTQRVFRLGFVLMGPRSGPEEIPLGRGWRQALIDAAVGDLEALK